MSGSFWSSATRSGTRGRPEEQLCETAVPKYTRISFREFRAFRTYIPSAVAASAVAADPEMLSGDDLRD